MSIFLWLTGLKNKDAIILERERNERAPRYTHFEPKNITAQLMTINSHCWLRATLQRLQCIFIILWKYYLNNRRTGAYSGAARTRVNTVRGIFISSSKMQEILSC